MPNYYSNFLELLETHLHNLTGMELWFHHSLDGLYYHVWLAGDWSPGSPSTVRHPLLNNYLYTLLCDWHSPDEVTRSPLSPGLHSTSFWMDLIGKWCNFLRHLARSRHIGALIRLLHAHPHHSWSDQGCREENHFRLTTSPNSSYLQSMFQAHLLGSHSWSASKAETATACGQSHSGPASKAESFTACGKHHAGSAIWALVLVTSHSGSAIWALVLVTSHSGSAF